MIDTNNSQTPTSKPKRFVRNSLIQDKLGVSAKTVRRWAKEFGWEQIKINERVIRFAAEDVEQSTGVSLD